MTGTNSSDEEGQKVKHRFSEPWEDSDVILVVEDEKFHVHRLILSMNSPVFKAMFKSECKEATSNEIPLPDKKVTEVLDFLKQLYVQEQQELTSEYWNRVKFYLYSVEGPPAQPMISDRLGYRR